MGFKNRLKAACKEPLSQAEVELKQEGKTMVWFLLGLLIYIQIGAVLVARVFSGLRVESSPGDMLVLVILWPFAIRFFRFVLQMQHVTRSLREWERDSK